MHAPVPAPSASSAASASAGARLIADDGRALSFRGGTLRAHAAGGMARLRLEQHFENVHAEPLQVTLQLPLPADAAVSGFSFTIGEERVVGRIDTRQRAQERFEEAILEGRTAALLEQDRSSLFRQRVGNVPPGETVTCEVVLDLPLVWEQGGWALRFPTVVAPRYQGAAARVADAARQLIGLAPLGTPARMGLELTVADPCTGPVHSPSHGLERRGTQVFLADEAGATLDRDLVVRWPVAAPSPGLSLHQGRASEAALADDAHGLLSIVPPQVAGAVLPRDLVVLLDTSGSMRGAPLAQAKAVTLALVESLGDQDQLQIIEFSTRPRAWQAGAVRATADQRAAAVRWVRALRAGGGTEMRTGILAALDTLRDEAQRQVVLVTDGLIGFESEIVGAVAQRLPRGCRVHTVGIGSAVNRSLLQPVARAGGGRELIIGVEEPAQAAAGALVAATAAPLVVDLELEGSALREVAHHRLPDLMAARPVRVAVRLDPHGGELIVRGHTATGPWEQRLAVPSVAVGGGDRSCVALFGRERAEELELLSAQGTDTTAALEALGLRFQVSTRLTSWVAISARPMVDPTAPSRAELVPQALPAGMSVAGLGLRGAGGPRRALFGAPVSMTAMSMPGAQAAGGASAGGAPSAKRRRRVRRPSPRAAGAVPPVADMAAPAPPAAAAPPSPQPAAPARTDVPRAEGGSGSVPKGAAEREEIASMDAFADDHTVDFAALEAAPAEAEEEPEAVDLPIARGARVLRGRVVLRSRARLVIEFRVDGAALAWGLPSMASVVTDTGAHTLEVDRARSTRPGQVVDGRIVRLVLAPLPADGGVLLLRILLGHLGLTVELDRE